ncbi:hypothetical protein Vafri_6878 [Volvox africanus]|uniref:PAS domain-containing protein n=1 Tax=Volvox africanus TaxID=51714 RepID=A0A8J4AZK2_9CHLO|nr:hypothetical protein Vafri_6878 [Volvox africanus]
MHAVVSGLALILFVILSLVSIMAQVEVNPLSKRPSALGHSGPEMIAFLIRVLMTLVQVVIGWQRVASCVHLFLSLALAWQYLRWNPHLVSWMNYLKGGISVTMVWCSATLMLLVFHPGVSGHHMKDWSEALTDVMLAGLAPAFFTGVLISWRMISYVTNTALKSLASAKPDAPLKDICQNIDGPQDVEVIARCCRVWRDRYNLDPEAVHKARQVIQAGLAMFPTSAYMVLLHGNFMIDVLGVNQSGSRRIEEARKLEPNFMCRFIMFVRHQQASQLAAGKQSNGGTNMDLLAYVEYQRKQRMVVRLHKEALQAICSFWKALDSNLVSFTTLSKGLSKIESSVSKAQAAYRVVLENYGNNPKLVRLYGKFLQSIKNDPWRASEYFAEAERLEEVQNGDASQGPLLPDGTPLGRMDEMATAVLVINAAGEVQVANKHAHVLFGYKRGTLEGKPVASLLAPHFARWFANHLASLVGTAALAYVTRDETQADIIKDEVAVGMHSDRLAFPLKLSMRKASGVGEDSTFITMLEAVPPVRGVASLWVAVSGTIVACDPQFVMAFGWRSPEVSGASLTGLVSITQNWEQQIPAAAEDVEAPSLNSSAQDESACDVLKRLVTRAKEMAAAEEPSRRNIHCLVKHKYDSQPVSCSIRLQESVDVDAPVHELHFRLADSDQQQQHLLVVNRKGAIVHASSEVVTDLKGVASTLGVLGGQDRSGFASGGGGLGRHHHASGNGTAAGNTSVTAAATALTSGLPSTEQLAGYTLCDFLPCPWKEMHYKFLKATSASGPPNSRNLWTCRKEGLLGPILEMRTASGKPLFVHTSVSTADVAGEVHHVIRLARSTVEAALEERRLQLQLNEDGEVIAVTGGNSMSLFGMDPGKLIGRALWDVLKWSSPVDGDKLLPADGRQMFYTIVRREVTAPGSSWRVQVSPPSRPQPLQQVPSIASELLALTTAFNSRPALLKVHLEVKENEDEGHEKYSILVDLWPTLSVSGLLEVDSTGRIRTVLEERTRPAGLLFGVPSPSLVGKQLAELLNLPTDRAKPGDLLSLNSIKKSSLKSSSADANNVKVGPLHVLQGIRPDGLPINLGVQVVGKPGPGHVLHVILKVHQTPMLPAAAATLANSSPAMPVAAEGRLSASASIVKKSLTMASSAVMEIDPTGLFTKILAAEDLATPVIATAVTASVRPSSGDRGPAIATTATTAATAGTKTATVSIVFPNEEGTAQQQGPPLPSPPALLGLPPVPAIVTSPNRPQRLHLPVGVVRTVDGTHLSASGAPASGTSRQVVSVTDNTVMKAVDLAASGANKSQMITKEYAGGVIIGDGDVFTGGNEPSAPPQSNKGRPAMRSGTPPPGQSAAEDMSPSGSGNQDGSHRSSSSNIDASSGSDVNTQEDGSGQPVRFTATPASERVSNWVASKGVFYQNSVPLGGNKSEDGSRPSDEGARGGKDDDDDYSPRRQGGPIDIKALLRKGIQDTDPPDNKAKPDVYGGSAYNNSPAPPGPRPIREVGGMTQDDDAASEGGQSALSAQSDNRTDYKRGKRYRKLVKLMESGQTQQVQQRFRSHALLTVTMLAAVHIFCFALTIYSILTKQKSMVELGRTGQAQRYLHSIITDVRSLDVIAKDKSLPTLYTREDIKPLITRISEGADEIQVRLREILDSHHSRRSPVHDLLFGTKRAAWDGNYRNGSNKYTELTIWEFSTRFIAMAKSVEQNLETWMVNNVSIADTIPGQFLIKSGPDLWSATRKVLDALMHLAVNDARWVDNLQLVFLTTEGVAITSIAACYLAYLLRALAAQRYKLYNTFMIIPAGLARTLASQNTSLELDDDDEEDDDDEDDKHSALESNPSDPDSPPDGNKQKKRHATVNLERNTESHIQRSGEYSMLSSARRGENHQGPLSRRSKSNGPPSPEGTKDLVRQQHLRLSQQASLDLNGGGSAGGRKGYLGMLMQRMRGALRFNSSTVTPLPQTSSDGQQQLLAIGTSAKRKLKYDSHEAFMVVTPFVIWSLLVIVIYGVCVSRIMGIVEVVAVHSVANFLAARTYRAVFFSQELVVNDDPTLLASHRAAVAGVHKVVRDAWYTLQLGQYAYIASGPGTEQFPYVKEGMAYASPELTDIFYESGRCHRVEGTCPTNHDYRFFQITRTSLDSMMQQYLVQLESLARDQNPYSPGMSSPEFDFIYNVGTKDLIGGASEIQQTHLNTIMHLFHGIFVLHIMLFILFWVIFGGFLVLLLFPLLKRVSREVGMQLA